MPNSNLKVPYLPQDGDKQVSTGMAGLREGFFEQIAFWLGFQQTCVRLYKLLLHSNHCSPELGTVYVLVYFQ